MELSKDRLTVPDSACNGQTDFLDLSDILDGQGVLVDGLCVDIDSLASAIIYVRGMTAETLASSKLDHDVGPLRSIKIDFVNEASVPKYTGDTLFLSVPGAVQRFLLREPEAGFQTRGAALAPDEVESIMGQITDESGALLSFTSISDIESKLHRVFKQEPVSYQNLISTVAYHEISGVPSLERYKPLIAATITLPVQVTIGILDGALA